MGANIFSSQLAHYIMRIMSVDDRKGHGHIVFSQSPSEGKDDRSSGLSHIVKGGWR